MEDEIPVADAVLAQPIDWRDTALWPMLDDLQGNILKGHGRDHTLNHFLIFDAAKPDHVRAQIRAIGTQVTSALRQLNEAEAYREFDRAGGTNAFFFLTANGYAKLGVVAPAGEAFAAGMAGRQLNDPPAPEWEEHSDSDIDALLIVADDSVTKVGNPAAFLTKSFADNGIEIAGTDAGHALRSASSVNEPKGRGTEHFGYVDGRSQPLMLTDDVFKETTQNGGIDKWDPSFGPGEAALVRDPNGTTSDRYGSFLVDCKREQDVAGFKKREDDLAEALGLIDPDDERAGAMVVGRFEDGTPLALSSAATNRNPTPNNFNYVDDPHGLKCPIHGHIRKVNPRQIDPRDEATEQRSHLMPAGAFHSAIRTAT